MNSQMPIVNRVARSPLVTIDLSDYYPEGERRQIDIAPQLYQGLILREKDFRAFIREHNWSQYQACHVAVWCSQEAIVPTWAYMLIATALAPYARHITYGLLDDLERELWFASLEQIRPEDYQDKKVVVKGCSHKPIPHYVFTILSRKLAPYVQSLMYGEPCSTVPILKKAKTQTQKEE